MVSQSVSTLNCIQLQIKLLYKNDTICYILFQITANKMQRFLIYLFLQTLYMFQAVPPPIIRST